MRKDKILTDESLDVLFRDARTYSAWQDKDVSDVTLQALYDLAKMGPTSMNCCPMRVVFVKSSDMKEKLSSALAEGNVQKTMTAPVTALIAYDTEFYEHLPTLFPHMDGKSYFQGKPDLITETAMRNSSLQGAYFIMAARSLGLDCGPMSGFNTDKLNDLFFNGTSYKINFLCNLGYGDEESLHSRSPRFNFDDVCDII